MAMGMSPLSTIHNHSPVLKIIEEHLTKNGGKMENKKYLPTGHNKERQGIKNK